MNQAKDLKKVDPKAVTKSNSDNDDVAMNNMMIKEFKDKLKDGINHNDPRILKTIKMLLEEDEKGKPDKPAKQK